MDIMTLLSLVRLGIKAKMEARISCPRLAEARLTVRACFCAAQRLQLRAVGQLVRACCAPIHAHEHAAGRASVSVG
eukprot:5805482-Pleurochrysis_carterae.AAC.1